MTNYQPTNTGIPYGEPQAAFVATLFDIYGKIGDVIKQAAMANTSVNYESISALVNLAIALIPDVEQGNKCREMLDVYEDREIEHLKNKKGTDSYIPTAKEINTAKCSASMAVMEMVITIFDDDLGIRKRFTVGLV